MSRRLTEEERKISWARHLEASRRCYAKRRAANAGRYRQLRLNNLERYKMREAGYRASPQRLAWREQYGKSLQGLLRMMYSRMRSSNKRRGFGVLQFTLDGFTQWCTSEGMEALYARWQQHAYASQDRPSVNRRNELEGYYFGNMELTTWEQNRADNYRDSLALHDFARDVLDEKHKRMFYHYKMACRLWDSFLRRRA